MADMRRETTTRDIPQTLVFLFRPVSGPGSPSIGNAGGSAEIRCVISRNDKQGDQSKNLIEKTLGKTPVYRLTSNVRHLLWTIISGLMSPVSLLKEA